MNAHHDRYDDDWLDNLDAITSGDALAPEGDEELLHVAERLASAFAPLRERARIATTNGQYSPSWISSRQNRIRRQTRQHLWSVMRLATVTILFLICLTGAIHTVGVATLWRGVHRTLQVSTSLEQINGISVNSLSPPHNGLKPLPLLPSVLPVNTQASTYGVLTNSSNPNIMMAFVADYRIDGQDVQVFEQPSDEVTPSTTAQIVRIGAQQGQLFQDDTGTHALQWYQNNMLCELTSRLSVALLTQLASVFQPIKSWDLVRS